MKACVVVLLLVCLVGLAVSGPCDTAPDVNGCSIPWNLPYFYKDVFKPDCNKHDVCYSCGKRNGVSRRICDQRFHANIKRTCRTNSRVKNEVWCSMVTVDYYAAVRIGGNSHYKQRSPSWCTRSWVKQCLT